MITSGYDIERRLFFLNFNGMTVNISSLWFCTVSCLIYVRSSLRVCRDLLVSEQKGGSYMQQIKTTTTMSLLSQVPEPLVMPISSRMGFININESVRNDLSIYHIKIHSSSN